MQIPCIEIGAEERYLPLLKITSKIKNKDSYRQYLSEMSILKEIYLLLGIYNYQIYNQKTLNWKGIRIS